MDVFAWTMLVRWLVGWLLLWRVPGLRASDAAEPLPDVSLSVVIPSRNEASVLPSLVGALQVQDLPGAEVVVVDDHSTDATAWAAARAGARVVASEPLPTGWTGKNWAAWQGAHHATGDLLVFLDADTLPAPDFLRRLVRQQQASTGLVSVQPYHRMQRVDERLAAFFNVIAVMGSRLAAPWHRRARGDGFGPAMICRRVDYLAVGGHEAVRDHVVEDRGLARRFTRAGLSVAAVGGRDVLSFRMYPRGYAAVVEGFTKNMYAGASGTPLWCVLAIVAWVSGAIVAAWSGTSFALGLVVGSGGPGWLAAAYYLAFAIQLAVMLRPLGNFGPTWLVFPLPLAFFLVVFACSLVAALRGTVTWKGRRIPLRAGRPS
jgi:4,4'-diaponeurosporenoate glycosyltransferase